MHFLLFLTTQANMISKAQQQHSFSETEKVSFNHSESEDKDSENIVGPVSSQLHLKSVSQALDKQVVLRRIRHRKSLNKVKSALETLLGHSEAKDGAFSAHDRKWLQQEDAFSAP
ncbi:hypothetical protein L6164_019970 [Bauhinia variegata]|uniref:Uncharacterized protein n=1 Tax=Bauhinia variegata TaxID=167791 RepID=A0ACB9MUX2_BAUVA|nr:hypothetical protein L6164_019970 [Bauhinia variegata]